MQKYPEAGVAANRIKEEIESLHRHNERIAPLDSSVQPLERSVPVAQPDVSERESGGRDIAGLRGPARALQQPAGEGRDEGAT